MVLYASFMVKKIKKPQLIFIKSNHFSYKYHSISSGQFTKTYNFPIYNYHISNKS